MQKTHFLKNMIALHMVAEGVSQARAAAAIGCHPARMSRLCNGRPGGFSEDFLQALIIALRIQTYWWTDRSGQPTAEALTKAQAYTPATLVRKPQPSRERLLQLFTDEGTTIAWRNSRKRVHAGRKIKAIDGAGYLTVTVDGVMMAVHRILWVMREGAIPKGGQIDHIDGDRLNNSPGNLRLTAASGNNRNRRIGRNNTSGVKGVTWNAKAGKWQAMLYTLEGNSYLGVFNNLEDAESVVRQARKASHGDFCNHGVDK